MLRQHRLGLHDRTSAPGLAWKTSRAYWEGGAAAKDPGADPLWCCEGQKSAILRQDMDVLYAGKGG